MSNSPPNLPPEEEAAEPTAQELADCIKKESGEVKSTVVDEAGGLDQSAENRAELLAQKVKDEAAAVTERVEQRARDLEERRVEHRAEERVESRADLQTELRGITVAIGALVEHMDQSLPEERVKKMAEAVFAEERHSRRQLGLIVLLGLAFVAGLVGLGIWQSHENGETLGEAKLTADYVRNCVQHPERLNAEQRAAQCGASAGSGQSGFIKYLNCAFLILPEDRTDAKLNMCASDAFGGR